MKFVVGSGASGEVGGWQPGNDTEKNSPYSANLMVSTSTDSQELFSFFPACSFAQPIICASKIKFNLHIFFFNNKREKSFFSHSRLGVWKVKLGRVFFGCLCDATCCCSCLHVSKNIFLSVHWASAQGIFVAEFSGIPEKFCQACCRLVRSETSFWEARWSYETKWLAVYNSLLLNEMF